MSKQVQRGRSRSTNVQANTVNISHGLSVADARDVALDVFRANFLQLAGEAAETAKRRAEELTDQFLRELVAQHPQGLGQSSQPDFQYALYTAQREYARTGDIDLGALLVDLLVDRAKERDRSILQIVLNESLAVAPKLTTDQVATLSVVFLVRYTVNRGLNSLPALRSYLEKTFKPFVPSLTTKLPCYQHLEYSGCGTIGLGSVELPDAFLQNYPGLWSKGFSAEELDALAIPVAPPSPLLTPSLHNSSLLQVNALNEAGFEEQATELGLSTDEIVKLRKLWKRSLLSKTEVKQYLESCGAYMSELIDVWGNSAMSTFTLTSVGIAIGHANIKKSLGEFTDLSIWIN